MLISTLLVFIIILGILVFVHEVGHFVLAKKVGAKVEEFGFGFPPRILKIKKGGTIYSINAIPLGGFVKILGEDGEDKQNKYSFANKKIWQRFLILIAGVTMNFLLAAVLLSIAYGVGLPQAVGDEENFSQTKVQISLVVPGSPAEQSGLKIGDEIISLQGKAGAIDNIIKTGQVIGFADANKGESMVINIKRGQEVVAANIIPRQNPPEGEGPMGIGLARVAMISYPWYESIWRGFASAGELTWLTIVGLGTLLWGFFQTGKMAADVYGPVGIFSLTGQAAQMGFIYLLQLAAILSLNLAVINALPFPALDGGRLLFLLIEKIKGSPVSQRTEKIVHSAGFAFLILLMAAVTLRDVVRLF